MLCCRFSLESPRWLLSCNKGEKALKVLERMASVNKKNLQLILQDIKEKDQHSARTELILLSLTYNPLTVSLSSAQLFHVER